MAQARNRGGSASSEARIGSSTRVRGRVSGEGSLIVEGRIEGNVAISGALAVSDGGVVHADVVEAESIAVSGTLEGEMRVSGNVHAQAGSRVRGNVVGGSVAIDDGAEFDGRVDAEFALPPELENGAGRSAARARR